MCFTCIEGNEFTETDDMIYRMPILQVIHFDIALFISLLTQISLAYFKANPSVLIG